MSSFSEQILQDKLSRLTSSQDSIETLSSWIIHHRTHASTSVTKWLQNVHQGDDERQLLLLYLANDVLQNSRRKGITMFHDLLKEPLKHAASLASTKKHRIALLKILKLWRERRIYDAIFLNELQSCVEPVVEEIGTKKMGVATSSEFKISILEDCLTELHKFEGEMKVKANGITRLSIDVSSESSLAQLKDKSAGGKFENDFEDASNKLQDYQECIGIEVQERNNLLAMLQQCKTHHEKKSKELKDLLKDYGNIYSHLQLVRQRLRDRVEQLDKASHTATSDPTSKQDITVAGDMEIDSDEDEPLPPPVLAPPTQPIVVTPTSFSPRPMPHFVPGGFQYPPPMASPLRQPLPLHSPPIAPPTPYHHPVPYSPSMPKLHTPPLTTPPLMPHPFHPLRDDRPLHYNSGRGPQDPVPPQSHMTPPPINASSTFNHSSGPNATPPVFLRTTTDTPTHNAPPVLQPVKEEGPDNEGNHDDSKPLPLSLFRDYSDSESDDENDNPAHTAVKPHPSTNISPPTQKSPVTTPTVNNTTTSVSDQATPTTVNNLPPVNHTHPATPIHTLSEAVASLTADNCAGTSPHLNPENIKITPTLTNLLDQIFPKLSESLKKRRHDNSNDDPAHPDETPPPNLKSPRVEPTNELQKFEQDISELSKVDNRPPQNHTHHSEKGHTRPMDMGHAPYNYSRPLEPYAPPFRSYPTDHSRMFPSPGMAPPPRHRGPFMSRPHRGRPARFYQAPPPSMGRPHY